LLLVILSALPKLLPAECFRLAMGSSYRSTSGGGRGVSGDSAGYDWRTQNRIPLSAIVFVGGSIATVGGHNILEPAAVGACIVTGPNTENFRDIVSTFAAQARLYNCRWCPTKM
jgi:hypothetical protein